MNNKMINYIKQKLEKHKKNKQYIVKLYQKLENTRKKTQNV